MKISRQALFTGSALALLSSVAFAMSPAEFRAETAVADDNYTVAMRNCEVLAGAQRAQCMDRARITRQNAVETARAQATTVTIIHPGPMPGTTPADRSDAVVAAEQKRYAAP
ncbi:MAG TPA: hypothetical protein VGN52_17295 [Burkholderiales bacterium]|jgi:uncharacterized membrane protein